MWRVVPASTVVPGLTDMVGFGSAAWGTVVIVVGGGDDVVVVGAEVVVVVGGGARRVSSRERQPDLNRPNRWTPQ
jgi:hypothetical protein